MDNPTVYRRIDMVKALSDSPTPEEIPLIETLGCGGNA
jgi:hypothetical protein